MLSGSLYIRTPGLTGGASALSGPVWVLREKSPGLCKEGAGPVNFSRLQFLLSCRVCRAGWRAVQL